MNITIGTFEPETRQVAVTFAADGRPPHVRKVNAVIGDDGEYDEEATRERIAEVALGVARKFDLGLLDAPVAEQVAANLETSIEGEPDA